MKWPLVQPDLATQRGKDEDRSSKFSSYSYCVLVGIGDPGGKLDYYGLL